MRIIKLEIANFRGVATKTDDGKIQPFKSLIFDSKFNVIIGVNGIGKTSILEALAMLLARILPSITPAPQTRQRFAPTDVRSGSSTLTGRIWLECDGEETLYSITEAINKKQSPPPDRDKKSFRRIAERYDRDHPDSRVSTPIALFYTTDRAGFRFSRKAEKLPLGRSAAYWKTLSGKMVNYSSIVEWLRKHRTLAAESETDRHLLEATEEALRRFLPAFGELEEGTDPPRLYVKKRGVRLGIEQLSDGERSFLAMVVDTARHLALANPNSPNPLTEGKGVVLIDELELHLHPKWQRSAVEHLQETFPKLQFITTTHSPFVIQSLQQGQLINLDPESAVNEYADRSIEDITEYIMGVAYPQKSQRYLDMMEIAEIYYRTLAQAKSSSGAELETLKKRLDELSIPYNDDPAFTAFLKFQRESILQEYETDQQRDGSS